MLSWCLNFNMNFFNNTPARSQVHGYLDVFDQFKVLRYLELYILKETDTLTKEDQSVGVLYTAYDPDAQGRNVNQQNIQKLMNCRWTYLKPFRNIRRSLMPIWDMEPSKYGDVNTNVRKVDNPWFEGRPQRASRLPVAAGHVPDLPGGLHDRRPLQDLAVAGEPRLPRVPVAVHVPEDGALVDPRRLELVEEPALPRA